MDFEDYVNELKNDVKVEASQSGEGTCASFIYLVAQALKDFDVLTEDYIPSYFFWTSKKGKKIYIDGYVWDEPNSTISIFVADFSDFDDMDRLLGVSEINRTFDRAWAFAENCIKGDEMLKSIEPSSPVSDIAELLSKHKERLQHIRLFFITDGKLRGSVTRQEFPSKEIQGIPVDYNVWNVERLFKIISSQQKKEPIEFDFPSIPCVEIKPSKCADYVSYLCAVPGNFLADIFEKYGSRLLEKNVRSFLSTKRAVNRDIRKTILGDPQDFFVYNNGIAATALDVSINHTHEGTFITHVNDFQIINGGQTTASLMNARFNDKADLSEICVQMKLTKINDLDESKAADFIQTISKSSNSQNKVSAADFFSNHPFHVNMEDHSKRIFAPASQGRQYETHWFYERARGAYLQEQMTMSKRAIKDFKNVNPKDQVITKTDLAKFRNSWDEKPNYVSKGAQFCFNDFAKTIDTQWTKNKSEFSEIYFKESVALAILFKSTEKLVSNAPWYQGGYRANIVTYSIALLHHTLKKKFPNRALDLMKIWGMQELPKSLEKVMVMLTYKVFEEITSSNRPIVNVTQWCKQSACWDRMTQIDVTIPSDLAVDFLIDRQKEQSTRVAGRKLQKLYNGIQIQSTLAWKITKDQWMEIVQFIDDKHIPITDKERGCLRTAVSPSKVLSELQCKVLIRVLKEVRDSGYKGLPI